MIFGRNFYEYLAIRGKKGETFTVEYLIKKDTKFSGKTTEQEG